MAKPDLKSFYTDKYDSERAKSSIGNLTLVDIPTTRNQAALKFLSQQVKGGDILEMGAGRGDLAQALLKIVPEIKSYTLSDLSSSRIEGVRKSIKDDRVFVKELDAEDVPESEQGKADCVIMVALIEHLVNPVEAMKNVRSLLKDGGFVYIETPNIAKLTKRILLVRGQFPSTASKNEGLTKFSGEPTDRYDEGHLHYFTYRSLSLMLTEKCGFSKVHRLAYPTGRTPLGKKVHALLVQSFPTLLSNVVIMGYK